MINRTGSVVAPWNSIPAGIVNFEEKRLQYAEALASPCASCQTSPCCAYLPLHTFRITNLTELDHAIYILNFDRIELGLSASGEWSVYYRYPCRFLNRQNFSCSLHNQPEQPKICVHYNPYSCWYKRVLTKGASQDFLRIDRQRLEFIVSQIVFDEFRNIIEVPNWEMMLEGVANLPLLQTPPDEEQTFINSINGISKDSGFSSDGKAVAEDGLYTYETLNDPCMGCQAYCCQSLFFPHPIPRTIANLDFLKFCLGFPGIQLGITDETWSIVVKTTCRHLRDNRCSVYGMPERPLICKYYDAWKCTYKVQFGLARPAGYVQVPFEHFKWLTECFKFDQHGGVTQMPTTDAIRNYIEDKARSAETQNGHELEHEPASTRLYHIQTYNELKIGAPNNR